MLIDVNGFNKDTATEIPSPVSFHPVREQSRKSSTTLMNNPLFMLGALPIVMVAWGLMAVWIAGAAAGRAVTAVRASPN